MIFLAWKTWCSPFLGENDDAQRVVQILADDDDRGNMESSERRLVLQELSFFQDSLNSFQVPSLGAGVHDWTGAKTNGDGACGLHSLFGVPDSEGRLHCQNARQQLVDALPSSWDGLLAKNDALLIAEALECLREQKDALREYLDAGSREGQMIFEALPDRSRQQVLMQAETKAELANEEQEAKISFKLLSQQLFRDEREECWVRPLALALGYVPSMQFDLLHSAPQELLESGYKDDEIYQLAKEVAERPGRTVYSSLFVEAAEVSTARWGFLKE